MNTGKRALPMYYSKQLGKKLSELIQEQVARPHHELLSLYEELAVARIAASKAIAIAEPALTGQVTDPKVVMLSVSLVKDALDHVKELVEAAANIEAKAEDKYSIKTLGLFVVQILKAIHSVVGDNPELIAKITQAIDDTVRMPMDQNRRAFDAHIQLAHVERDKQLVAQMDAFTAPSGAAAPVDVAGSLQDSGGGSPRREDGAEQEETG